MTERIATIRGHDYETKVDRIGEEGQDRYGVSTYLSPEDYRFVRAEAKAKSLPMSHYLRKLIQDARRRKGKRHVAA